MNRRPAARFYHRAVPEKPAGAAGEPLEEAVSRLFGERPEDFVAARTRLVRELRAGGQAELAARLASVRRPTLSLWTANRLHEIAPEDFAGLLQAGSELQEAQSRAAGGDSAERSRFRELIGRHSELVDRLVRAGRSLLQEHGYGAGDELNRRLAATLRAASTEPGDDGRRLARGSLQSEPEPSGFGLMATSTGADAPVEGGEAPQPTRQQRAAERRARAVEARREATDRERAAVAARTKADELARRARQLTAEAAEAREQAEAADREATEAERAAAEAWSAVKE
jgi:hypothetical protein